MALAGVLVAVAYPRSPTRSIRDLLYNTFTTSAGLLVLLGVRLNRPSRRWPWLVLGAGMLLMSTGDWTWTYLERVLEVEPFPSLADVFYLSGVGLLVVSVLGILRGRLPGGDRRACWTRSCSRRVSRSSRGSGSWAPSPPPVVAPALRKIFS